MKTPVLYKLTRPIIKFLVKIIYLPRIEGVENIPESDGVILAGNHTNNLDCFLLISSTKRCIRFLAKDSLYKSSILRGMGIIPIDRVNHNNEESIKKTNDILNDNGVIAIFPEGTINRTNETIMPFKIGAVKFASVTGKSIVPFTIKGKYKLFSRIKLTFYKPIKVESNDLDKENNKFMNIIKNNLEG
jgi:1-acyl-sn-glycerol-3-phosphate acyltransferase